MVWKLLALAGATVLALLAINRVPLTYTLRNLSVRWVTTLLTALAFTFVIGLLVVMLAFTNGMRRMTEGTGQPGNVLVLAEGSTDESFSNLSVSDLAEIEHLPQVERDSRTGRPLASRETYLIVNQPLPHATASGAQRRFLQLRGIEDPAVAVKVHEVELLPGGRWFSEAGVAELPEAESGAAPAVQTVLGEGLARVLAADRTAEERAAAAAADRLGVGDRFRLGERTWIVTGIMKSAGSAFGSELWAKRSLVGPIFGKDTCSSLLIRTKDAATAEQLKTYLSSEYKQASVSARLETEYYEALSETNQQFLVAIIFVTVVMSIGGVLGVMNTMFAAVSHRIQDIGVLRLLGYKRRQILVSFLLESLVIALVGGLAGCALGSLSDGWTASSMMAGSTGGGKFVVLQLSVDAHTWAVGVCLTLLMGGLGGLIPALSAMRLRPLEALR
ncbi:MAG: ABC transporter permease [Thermoguttaceae bacterium]|jgi:ABC-type lipoprotein release transport system permease subunit